MVIFGCDDVKEERERESSLIAELLQLDASTTNKQQRMDPPTDDDANRYDHLHFITSHQRVEGSHSTHMGSYHTTHIDWCLFI